MSLYIGEDVNGNNVLHVTKGSTSASDMRTGILDSTIFHSDMKFLTYKEFEVTVSITPYYCRASRLVPPYIPMHTIDYSHMPSEAVSLLRAGHLFVLVDSTYQQVGIAEGRVIGENLYGCLPKHDIGSVFYRIPSVINNADQKCYDFTSTYDDPRVYGLGVFGNFSTTPTKILIFNLKINGEYVPSYSYSNTAIVVNKDSFNIKGVDFSSIRYLQSAPYTGSRRVTSKFGGSLYEVNRDATLPGFTLTTSNSNTIIKVGNNVVLDSSNPPISNHLNQGVTYNYTFTVNNCSSLTDYKYIGDFSSYIGKAVLIAFTHTKTIHRPNVTTPDVRTRQGCFFTTIIDNSVIGDLDYGFTVQGYYNNTSYYGAFNQAVLRVVNGHLYLSGITSVYPYSQPDINFSGTYYSPYDDIILSNGILTIWLM